ncbi:MAG TPA: 1-acyl-sn-glycerol-3-phosphate acyltransferase [Candidatus Saccharimonadales bacterium]|nr:1-acyl-sn-glycerol-3-phosphate acyltransferase [Candidatus Saccharimonadales bacterium]
MAFIVPKFEIGEIDPVLAYAVEAVPRFCERIGCDNPRTIHNAFMAALVANANRIHETLTAAYVPRDPASRRLLTLMESVLVRELETDGHEHLLHALKFMEQGGNVLLVSNHTSGADTLVLDWVANKVASDAAHSWTYMAGHVVNLYLLPLVVAGGVNRLQIFSERYAGLVSNDLRQQMRAQNASALLYLRALAEGGGQCVVLYPEGGRGEGALKPGEPQTMQIAQLIARVSPEGLLVLPSYVASADILPVRRTQNEFNEFVEHARPGNATLRFGPGIPWQDLQPSGCMNPAALRSYLIGRVMMGIADLAPTLKARGPHNRKGSK